MKIKKMVSTAFAFATVLAVATAVSAADGDVEISKANFPDSNFRDFISSEIDNGDGVLSVDELNSVKEINCFDKGISDFTGIEKFKNLEVFKCENNTAKQIDLSKNTKIKILWCNDCPVSELDLSKNTNLEELYCGGSSLKSLDITKNTELKVLDCYSASIKTIDLSHNTNLETVGLAYCDKLTSLDVSKNTNLIALWMYGCRACEKLTLNNSNLRHLEVVGIGQDEVDISKCPLIVDVYLNGLLRASPMDQFYCDVEYLDEKLENHQSFDVSPYTSVYYGKKSAANWKVIDGNKYYVDGNGNKLRGTKKIDGSYYYLDHETGCLKTGWIVFESDGRYYADKNGVIQNYAQYGGWFKAGSKWYFAYYAQGVECDKILELNGVLYKLGPKGARETGWYTDSNGKKYYFTSKGAAKGWKEIDKKWYYFKKTTCTMVTGVKKLSGKYYLFSKKGVMLKSGWKDDAKGNTYYLRKDGSAYTKKWTKKSGKWYYFGSNGKMVKGTSLKIGKKTYKFDSKGICKNP